jgi:hypothetical protein
LIRYFGEFPEFYLLCAIFVSILLFRILHIFNHSNCNEYEWLNFIKVLNGSQSLDSLKINNKNEIQKYARKIKTFKFCLTFCVYLILFFNYWDLIRFGLLCAFIYLINCYFWMSVIGFSFFYYFNVCYYCKTILESFNNSIKQLFAEKGKEFLKYKTIDQLMNDHNSICLDIKINNKFWQKY